MTACCRSIRLALATVAVIGPNAGQLEAGGGSSEVTPHVRRRLADALAERLPGVKVGYEIGCRIHKALPNLDVRLLTDESLSLTYFDNVELSGEPKGHAVGHSARMLWVAHLLELPEPILPVLTSSVRIAAEFTPDVSGVWKLGLESAGGAVWRLDGEVVLDNSEPAKGGTGFYGAGSVLIEAEVELEAGRAYAIEVDLWSRDQWIPVIGARLAADRPEPDDEFERAVALAASSEVAVVVVGSNGSWESEGFDRPDLSLPGRQRELVEAVIAANPRTVVVVNAGSPVEMPWADAAGAVLLPWYSGEEGADAIADILVGLSDPGGRLPVSLPRRVEDTSAFGHYPGATARSSTARVFTLGTGIPPWPPPPTSPSATGCHIRRSTTAPPRSWSNPRTEHVGATSTSPTRAPGPDPRSRRSTCIHVDVGPPTPSTVPTASWPPSPRSPSTPAPPSGHARARSPRLRPLGRARPRLGHRPGPLRAADRFLLTRGSSTGRGQHPQ